MSEVDHNRVLAPKLLGWHAGEAAVAAPFGHMQRDKPALVGQLVMLDDELYRVTAVHCKLAATHIRAGETIGLALELADGWSPVRRFGKPHPVAWARTRGDAKEIPVIEGEEAEA